MANRPLLTERQAFDAMLIFLGFHEQFHGDIKGWPATWSYSDINDAGQPILADQRCWSEWTDAVDEAIAPDTTPNGRVYDEPQLRLSRSNLTPPTIEGWYGNAIWFEVSVDDSGDLTIEFYFAPPKELPVDDVIDFVERARDEARRFLTG